MRPSGEEFETADLFGIISGWFYPTKSCAPEPLAPSYTSPLEGSPVNTSAYALATSNFRSSPLHFFFN